MKPLCFSVLAACLLSACTSYGPQSLGTGSSIEATTRAMGAPTGETALPGGGRRLEYARGPYGKHTYMVDFDAQGQLLRWAQVLTEARFNAIRGGMDSSEVLAQIGRASERYVVGWHEKQTVWAYRYETPFCQWFQVGINVQGKVVDTAYGPDPMCDADDFRDHTTPYDHHPLRHLQLRHREKSARLAGRTPRRCELARLQETRRARSAA